MRLGVLAYGSLVAYPGAELARLITGRTADVQTPFRVEFARRAATRGGAPTLAPVEEGGAPVRATLLHVAPGIALEELRDVLFRRELHVVGSGSRYDPATTPLRLHEHRGLGGLDVVLSVALPVTVPGATPVDLARWALASVRAAPPGLDGVTYLEQVREAGIETPVAERYAAELLRLAGAATLAEARARAAEG